MPLNTELVAILRSRAPQLASIQEISQKFSMEDWLASDEHKQTYLHLHASIDAHFEVFEFLCEKCAALINQPAILGEHSQTILMLVVNSFVADKKARVECLLKYGAKIEVYDYNGKPLNPLQTSTFAWGYYMAWPTFELFKILIAEYKAEINQIKDPVKQKCVQVRLEYYLEFAWLKVLSSKQAKQVKYFLEELQYNVNSPLCGKDGRFKKYPIGKLAIHVVLSEFYSQEVFEELLTHPQINIAASYNFEYYFNMGVMNNPLPCKIRMLITPVVLATSVNNQYALKRLLSFPETQINVGYPLHHAISGAHTECAQLLIDAGILLDQRSPQYGMNTPLELINTFLLNYANQNAMLQNLSFKPENSSINESTIAVKVRRLLAIRDFIERALKSPKKLFNQI